MIEQMGEILTEESHQAAELLVDGGLGTIRLPLLDLEICSITTVHLGIGEHELHGELARRHVNVNVETVIFVVLQRGLHERQSEELAELLFLASEQWDGNVPVAVTLLILGSGLGGEVISCSSPVSDVGTAQVVSQLEVALDIFHLVQVDGKLLADRPGLFTSSLCCFDVSGQCGLAIIN